MCQTKQADMFTAFCTCEIAYFKQHTVIIPRVHIIISLALTTATVVTDLL